MLDYKKENFCNAGVEEAYAIELEVWIEFANCVLRDYTSYYESDNIKELFQVHRLSEADRLNILELSTREYKDKFPVGEDECISGGCHFHLFGNYIELKNNKQDFKEVILNCPLHLKIWKGQLYGRSMEDRAFFWWNDEIRFNSKCDFISLKDEFWTSSQEGSARDEETDSIEFRCNNVIDSRILGFYQGVTLAVQKWVKLKEISYTAKMYGRNWDDNCYYYESSNQEDIFIKGIEWISLSKEDKKVVRVNIKTIFSLLKEEGLEGSAKALREYLRENGIRYI